MNEIKVYVNGDHTINHYSGGYMATNGNGNAGVKVIAPFLVTHTLYALYRKPNGIKANRYLMVATGDTETVEVSAGVFEEWNIWTDVIDATVINIDSAVAQSVGLVVEDWYFKPEDGFLGIVQYSADIPAYLTAQGLTPVEGDFIRVVDTNTDWEYLSTVWTDRGTIIVGTESRVPVQLVDLPADASFATGLPTVAADNTEVIISILNGKMSITTAVATFVKQELTEYDSGGSVAETDLIYIDRGGIPKYVTASQIAAGGGGIVNGSDSWLASLGFIDTGDISRMSWNATEQCIDTIINANVTLQNGRELLKLGRNTSGVTITNGQVIAIIGSVGNVAEIELLDITDTEQSFKVIGMATEDILNNAVGNINLIGRVRGLDTSAWAEGTILYADTAGGLSSTCPAKGNRCVLMAVVETSNAGAGIVWQFPRPLSFLGELSDVYAPTPSDRDMVLYNASNTRYQNYSVDNILFIKTGWDLDIQALVSLAFVDATRTFTLAKTGAVVPYWQENVKYELDADLTVVIDDIEGLWFIYIINGILIASQTAWDLRADNAIPVSVVNWDATNKEAVAVAYECHSWLMSGVDHYDSHFGLGTLHIRGGGLSGVGNPTLDLTGLTLADEDINIVITDDDTPTAYFEQPLTPLKSYKYYRDGANGDLRRVEDSTIPFYLISNKVQLNPFSGGVWGLTPMTNNKYGAYWNIWTTDISHSVKQFLGQEEADSLDDAIASNTLSSLDLGTIPFEEIKVAYRIIVKQIVASPYYEIIQIDNMLVDPITGVPTLTPSSHGALSGLGDDDHTQYFNAARLAAYKASTIDPDIALRVEKDLANNTTYPVATAAGIVDDELTNLFIDDNGIPKKIALNEIYVGANAATGAFVASGDYKPDGLGSYKSAMLTYFTLTLDTLGRFRTTIKTQVTDQILYIQLPTIASNTNKLELSTDNGVVYYDVLLNGNTVQAEKLSEQLVELQFNGTNFIILNAVDIDNIEVFYAGETGAYKTDLDNVDHDIEGEVTTIIETTKGLSVNQPLDGDFTDGTTNYTGVGGTMAVVSNELTLTIDTPTISNRIQYNGGIPSFSAGLYYVTYMVFSAVATSATVYLGDGYLANVAIPAGVWTRVSGIKTVANNNELGFYINRTTTLSATDEVIFKDIMILNIENNAQLNTLTAEQISSRITEYIEGINSIENLNIDSTLNGETSNLVVRGTMRSVGDVYDTPTLQSVEVDISVAIGATINNTTLPLISLTSKFIAVDNVNGDTQHGTYGDTLTLTNISTVYYALATPIPQELDIDGAILTSVDATFVQSSDNGLNNVFSVIQAENFKGRVDIMNDRILINSKENKEVQVNLDTTNEAVALRELLSNKVTAFSSPTNIQYPSAKLVDDRLNINDTAVGLNTAKNSYPSGDETKVGYLTVTGAVNLNKVAEYTELWSGSLTIPTDTTKPGAVNITGIVDTSNYDKIFVEFASTKGVITDMVTTLLSTENVLTMSKFLFDSENRESLCKFELDTVTTATIWYSRLVTYGATYANIAGTAQVLTKIIGIKYT